MDWRSALILIVVVLLMNGDASAAGRKKIKIYIPQRVKHIHHHEKIYITKHVTEPTAFVPPYANSEHYATGYLSPTETVTAIAPALTILPLPEERHSAPGSSPAPNIQPLYRARGHYGPTSKYVTEIKPVSTTKRVKIIKVADGKKRVIKMKKPKRIIIKDDPIQNEKDNNPVSSYHKEFYSDMGPAPASAYRMSKKPKRVEKYVNGDTEHIHTYSEEHIHQVVYDDEDNLPGPTKAAMVPLDAALQQSINAPVASFAIPTAVLPSVLPPVIPMQAAPNSFGTIGSMGTPAHLEYMQYDPRDVTHDHIFHDHGEIIHTLAPEKEMPGLPKASYNSQGVRINPTYEGSGSWESQNNKNAENIQDMTYYENLYTSKKGKNKHKNSIKSPSNINYSRYKYADETPINSDVHHEHYYNENGKPYRHKANQKIKGYKPLSTHQKPKHLNSLRQQYHSNVSQNKPYGAVTVGSQITINNNFKESKDPSYKHYTNIYSSSKPAAIDDFTAPVTGHKKEEDVSILNWRTGRRDKNKKSISTQNISFGGQEHKSIINHENAESRNLQMLDSSAQSSNINNYFSLESPSNINGASAVDASNYNIRVVAPPILVAPERQEKIVERISTTERSTASSSIENVHKQVRKSKKKNSERKSRLKQNETAQQPPSNIETTTIRGEQSKIIRGKFKYGDKLKR